MSSVLEQAATHSTGEPPSDAAWRAFLSAQTDPQFFAAWLRVLCETAAGFTSGVVLLRSEPDRTFIPTALWPEEPRDLSYLGPVTEEALRLNTGVLRPAPAGAVGFHAAIPLQDPTGLIGLAVFELAVRPEHEAQRLLRLVHWGLGWVESFLSRRRGDSLARSVERLSTVMDVLADLLRPLPLQQILLELVNQVGRQLRASRVVIGLRETSHLRVVAMSDVAYFEANSDAAAYYLAAMEEAIEAYEPIRYVIAAPTDPTHERPAHAQLAAYSRASAVLTVPLQLGSRSLGALCAERAAGDTFSDEDVDWLHALASLLPAVIEQRRRAERSAVARLKDSLLAFARQLLGPGHLSWKCSALAGLALLGLLFGVHIDYRVTAHTVIEGEIQRSSVAPFDGYVEASSVRAGDVVHRGELLCQLDDRDLRLERDKWANEREQHARELRQALATGDLANVEVTEAELKQSEAHLALAEEQIGKARVTAPFDGVIISGDLTQLIGSPVERGKKLFEIAPLSAYRVILEVDERDIRQLALKQSGTLLVTSLAEGGIPFRVSTITPVSTAKDGRNYFRVEARLQRAPATLRPGMEGVGKIVVGNRQLGWVLTHSATDWLRLWIWRWLP
jgi:Barrel-sandwich domain of CusB or HlyD membrane-fusion/GAF domain